MIDWEKFANLEGKYAFGVTKEYCHNLGLSICFRQWSDVSHCRFMHGYALQISLDFASRKLNNQNWVVPLGGLKSIKEFLVEHFDHKTLVAQDDPELVTFQQLHEKGIVDLIIVPNIGIEIFAKILFCKVNEWLEQLDHNGAKVVLRRVTVKEHEANGGYFEDLEWQDKL